MPSFLIVHSQPPGGRADLFAQPPMLDVSGLGARLDWGDTTFEVPPGDHRVTISVAPVSGGQEGAVVTVRVLPETGTRISFAPPAVPGQPSTLRVDGQWPADAAMAYYAARDQRPPSPVAQQQLGAQPAAGTPAWAGPQSTAADAAPRLPQGQPGAYAPPQRTVSRVPPAQAPMHAPAPQQSRPASPPPAPSVPPVGPSIGSTGSVPIVGPPSSAPTFGQVQGAVVEPGAQQPHPPAPPPNVAGPGAAPAWGQQQPTFAPPAAQQPPQQHVAPPAPAPSFPQQQRTVPPVVPVQPPVQHVQPPYVAPQHAPPQQPQQQPPRPQPGAVAPPAFGPGAPQHPPMQSTAQPAFGHEPIVRRDVYGRDRVDGDRSAPAIPTPRQFEDFARAERDRQEAEAVAASRQQQGWYPDPYGRSDVRWHDGERWTASVMRGGRREADPV